MSRHAPLAALALALYLLTPTAGTAADSPPAEAPAVAAARTALEQGDHRRALILLLDRLQQDPADGAARHLLVRVRLDLGQGVEAEEELARLQAGRDAPKGGATALRARDLAAPDLADLGRALLLQGQFLRLLGAVDPGVAKGEDNARLRAELSAQVGEAHLGLGEPDAARVRLREARTLDPANVRALLGLARLAFREKDPAGAADLVTQALAADPGSAQGLELQGELAYLRGGRRAAEAAYSGSIAHAANPWMTHFKRAMVRLDLNDLDGAEVDLAAARTGDPDFAGLDLAQGALALRRGDPGAAIQLLERFLKSAPGDPQAAYLTSLALARTGRHTEALRYLEPLSTARPDDPAVAVLKAGILLEQGQAAAAEAVLAPVSGATGPVEADRVLARALAAQGRQAEALVVLRRLVERAPDQPDDALALAAGLADAGDRTGARAQLQRLLQAVPGNLAARLALVRLALADGATDAALTQARALAQDEPGSARVQELLGVALAASGDGVGARTALVRAQGLDPKSQLAALALARLALQDKDPKAARIPLEALLRADAQNTAAQVQLAALEVLDQDQDAAAERLRKGLAAAPLNLDLRLALSQLLVARKDIDGALAVLAEAPPEQAGGAAVLRARGLLELAAERPAPALKTFEQLAATDPDGAGPRYLMILARTAKGAPKAPAEIADALTEALTRDPAHPLAGAALSAAFAVQPGDEARTLLALRLAKVAPGQPALAFEQGRLALARGDQAAALTDLRYRRALIQTLAAAGEHAAALESGGDWLATHPDDLQTRAVLAQLELNEGRSAAAADHYRAILAREPKNPLAQNNLAMLLLDTDPKAALALAEQAHATRPEEPEIADTLGAVLLALQQPARALAVLEPAARLPRPANPSLVYHLAAALAATGAPERARGLLTDLAEQEFPERAAARALLAELQARPETQVPQAKPSETKSAGTKPAGTTRSDTK